MIHTDPRTALRLLEGVATLTNDGLFVFDREFRFVLYNEAMERIVGIRAAEILGKQAFAVFPFLVESGEDRLFAEVLTGRSVSSTGRPFYIEGTRRSGYYDARYAPWRGPDGEILGGIVFVRDTTESKLAREQLEETERRFKNMADVAPVLLWMSREDGFCTFFNQTWLNFTGKTLEEEWGVGWAEGIHFEDFQRCMDTYVESFNRRAVFEMEYRLLRHDGVYRWILDRGTPRYLPDGTFAGFIGSCVDITERKELERSLRQAVRARDEFLAIASHELRTPITALELHLATLARVVGKSELPDVERARLSKHAVGSLNKAAHLTTMVNTLLDISRLSEGKLPVEREPLDFAALVRGVVDRFQDAAAEVGSTLGVTVDRQLRGDWDRFRIEQVVTNLLSNAVKYGMGKQIDIVATSTPQGVRLLVADRGIGIAESDQPHVFDRFARFVPARRYGGFGLGLWISREIVHAHGGTIELESRPGNGSTFVVNLPSGPSVAVPRHVRSSPPSVSQDA